MQPRPLSPLTRRRFLAQSAAAAVAAAAFPSIIPSSARGAVGKTAPSNHLRLALIGSGSRAQQVLREFTAEHDARDVFAA